VCCAILVGALLLVVTLTAIVRGGRE